MIVLVIILGIASWLILVELMRETYALLENRVRTADERWNFSWPFIGKIFLCGILIAVPYYLLGLLPSFMGKIGHCLGLLWSLSTMFASLLIILRDEPVLFAISQSIRLVWENLAIIIGVFSAVLIYFFASISMLIIGIVLSAYIWKLLSIIIAVPVFVFLYFLLELFWIIPVVLYVNIQRLRE